jgi:four helix bundle protein
MLRLEDLEVYNSSMTLSDKIWEEVIKWDFFSKDTLGKQLVRASDSVSANISEGFGRFSNKENKQFCYYSRGSITETKTFLYKAKNRQLISEDKFNEYIFELERIHKMLNAYIKSIGKSGD